jgi:IPT/TIG domain
MPYKSDAKDKRRGLLLGIFYVALAIGLGYMLIKIWPPVPWPDPNIAKYRESISQSLAGCGVSLAPLPENSASPKPGELAPVALPINFFFKKCVMTSFDERLILLVIVAGILGSFIHGATSLADYIGNDRFCRRWTWFYLLRPVIGMALALVFYFVIRGGFLTTNVGATDINPYGIAALAGLVGMFSKQATDKLSEVFSTLFRSGSGEGDEKRRDPLKPENPVTVIAIDPAEVPEGGEGFTLTVTGNGFVEGSTVVLNDAAQLTTFVNPEKLNAEISKEAIAAAGTLTLTVVNPDETRSTPVEFKVVAATASLIAIESVEPSELSVNVAGQTITITGAGFVADSKVLLDGQEQNATFVSGTILIAQIAELSVTIAGVCKLQVINPDGSASPELDVMVS